MKVLTIPFLSLLLGLSQVAQASLVNIGSTGRSYDTERIIAESIIASRTTHTSSRYHARGGASDPIKVANFEQTVNYWETDKLMNPDVTMTFFDANKIVNGTGNDGLIFVASPSEIWGRTMGVSINGTKKEIFANILVGQTSSGYDVFAGLFDLTDFGVSTGDSVNSMTIFSSVHSTSSNYSRWARSQIGTSEQYGNYSDTMFAGGGTLNPIPNPNPVPLPTAFLLFVSGLGFLSTSRNRKNKSI